jgi:hypothetical protein
LRGGTPRGIQRKGKERWGTSVDIVVEVEPMEEKTEARHLVQYAQRVVRALGGDARVIRELLDPTERRTM